MTTVFDTLPLLANDKFHLRKVGGRQPEYLLHDVEGGKSYKFQAKMLTSITKCNGVARHSILHGRINTADPEESFTLFFCVHHPNAEGLPEVRDLRRFAYGDYQQALRDFNGLSPSVQWSLFGL